MSISWKYGDLSPARYPSREEKEEKKKKKPSKRSRASQKHDVVREAAEPPAKIMKDAKEIRRQKDAERRKKKREEKKKRDEAELNKATETLDALITSGPPPTETVAWTPLSAELKELLESVPDLEDLPSYEAMMEPLLPTQGSVVVTPEEVKPEPQEPAVVTPMEPRPNLEPGAVLEPLPEPSPEPKVPLCPFHETPLGENQTRGDPSFRYVYCKEYDEVCPFWVMGVDRAYEWQAEVPPQLHHDIKKGPWHCFCGEKSKVVRTMNPDSPNVGRFFLTCRQNMPCRFFQWLDREWSDQIFQHRWQEARKNGWTGEREEKASGLLEVNAPWDPHQARKKQELENETVVIQVPSLPDDQLEEELEKYVRKRRWMAQQKKWMEHDELQQRWCRRLERTRPITPELLHACFKQLKMLEMEIDQV